MRIMKGVSVPPDVKKLMDRLEFQPNWSSIAVNAFLMHIRKRVRIHKLRGFPEIPPDRPEFGKGPVIRYVADDELALSEGIPNA